MPQPTTSEFPDFQTIFAQVREALPSMKWIEVPSAPGILHAYWGRVDEPGAWSVMVVDYQRDGGQVGYEGTGTCLKEGIIMRLTPELAKEVFDVAAKAKACETKAREV